MAFSLLAGVAQAQSSPLPDVYLNHISITVSPETYKALAAAEFLRDEFASSEQRVTQFENEPASQALYLFGRDTFIEFVRADANNRIGSIGIGMGIEDQSQLPEVQQALSQKLSVPLQIHRRSWSVDHQTLPWFEYIHGDWMPPGPLDVSVMAYHPDYVQERSAGVDRSRVTSVRAQVLAHQHHPDRLMRDVRRLVLWSEPAEINSLTGALVALGFQLSFDGPVENLRGPDIEFNLIPLKAHEERKVEIYFSLTRKYTGPLCYRFPDNSTLAFVSSLAQWSFPGRIKPDPNATAVAAKKP